MPDKPLLLPDIPKEPEAPATDWGQVARTIGGAGIRVASGIGSTLTSEVPGIGTLIGGAIGGGGDMLAQMLERGTLDPRKLNKAEIAAEAALGAIPLGKILKGASTGAKAATRTLGYEGLATEVRKGTQDDPNNTDPQGINKILHPKGKVGLTNPLEDWSWLDLASVGGSTLLSGALGNRLASAEEKAARATKQAEDEAKRQASKQASAQLGQTFQRPEQAEAHVSLIGSRNINGEDVPYAKVVPEKHGWTVVPNDYHPSKVLTPEEQIIKAESTQDKLWKNTVADLNAKEKADAAAKAAQELEAARLGKVVVGEKVTESVSPTGKKTNVVRTFGSPAQKIAAEQKAQDQLWAPEIADLNAATKKAEAEAENAAKLDAIAEMRAGLEEGAPHVNETVSAIDESGKRVSASKSWHPPKPDDVDPLDPRLESFDSDAVGITAPVVEAAPELATAKKPVIPVAPVVPEAAAPVVPTVAKPKVVAPAESTSPYVPLDINENIPVEHVGQIQRYNKLVGMLEDPKLSRNKQGIIRQLDYIKQQLPETSQIPKNLTQSVDDVAQAEAVVPTAVDNVAQTVAAEAPAPTVALKNANKKKGFSPEEWEQAGTEHEATIANMPEPELKAPNSDIPASPVNTAVQGRLAKLSELYRGLQEKLKAEGGGAIGARRAGQMANAAKNELDQLADAETLLANAADVNPEAVSKAQQFVDFMKKKYTNEAGYIDPDLLMRIGGGLAGATVGAAEDDEHPMRGAVLGGAAGVALPSVVKRIANPEILGNVASTAKDKVEQAAELVPDFQRFNLLSNPVSLFSNAALGPLGSATMGGLHAWAKGDPRGKELLRLLAQFPRTMINTVRTGEAEDVIGAAERAEKLMHEARTPAQKFFARPGELMFAGDVTARKLGMQAGFSEDEMRKMTLTAEPVSALGKFLANQGKTRTEGGIPSSIAQVMLPFKRTTANVVESGLDRTPIVGSIFNKYAKDAVDQDDSREQLYKQGMGGVVFATAYQLGKHTDHDPAKEWTYKKFLSDFGGQYSMLASAGYAAGVAARNGKSGGKQMSTAARNYVTNMPLPTTQSLEEYVKLGESLLEGKPMHPDRKGAARYLPRTMYPGFLETSRNKPDIWGRLFGKDDEE